MNSQTETITIAVTTFKLNKNWVIDAFRKAGYDFRYADSVKVEFEVPGGADWSGMRIDIDNDNPIIVTVTDKSIEIK